MTNEERVSIFGCSFELEVSAVPLDPKKNPEPDPDTGVPISALLS